jgi:hypothetical protein
LLPRDLNRRGPIYLLALVVSDKKNKRRSGDKNKHHNKIAKSRKSKIDGLRHRKNSNDYKNYKAGEVYPKEKGWGHIIKSKFKMQKSKFLFS